MARVPTECMYGFLNSTRLRFPAIVSLTDESTSGVGVCVDARLSRLSPCGPAMD